MHIINMKISILTIGKTSEGFVKTGIEEYQRRLKYYLPMEIMAIPDIKDRKNLSIHQIMENETKLLLNHLPKAAYIILLDDKGREFNSMEFSSLLSKQIQAGTKELVFIIGGAYGVTDNMRHQVNLTLSLSLMTFTHQFIRLILIEQIYRAMTILNCHPYHNP